MRTRDKSCRKSRAQNLEPPSQQGEKWPRKQGAWPMLLPPGARPGRFFNPCCAGAHHSARRIRRERTDPRHCAPAEACPSRIFGAPETRLFGQNYRGSHNPGSGTPLG